MQDSLVKSNPFLSEANSPISFLPSASMAFMTGKRLQISLEDPVKNQSVGPLKSSDAAKNLIGSFMMSLLTDSTLKKNPL